MSLLYPTIYLKSIAAVTPDLLSRWGVRGLILDVDNTLTTHNNPDPAPEVEGWLELMRENHIEMIILSNNHPGRVRPFAQALGMGFTANAGKPRLVGFKRAAAELGLPKEQIAVVGDQIFTDILGGNRWGARTILIKPIEPENDLFFRVKRRLERIVMRKRSGYSG
ncbi:MAG: YqeG family HAD IIIA-type phosphatase [Oscillospiraceae bacterium]|nr:YqeG family HAD IIIA-type phosphatase [Oscillospiraceae bacterium]